MFCLNGAAPRVQGSEDEDEEEKGEVDEEEEEEVKKSVDNEGTKVEAGQVRRS